MARTLLDDILAQYKDLIGQFMMADAVLIRIRNRIISSRETHGVYESEYQRLRDEYDFLDKTLNAILDRVSLFKVGRGGEVSITELMTGIYQFASRCEKLLKAIGEMEYRIFGSTRITGMRNPMLGLLPIAALAFVTGSIVAGVTKRK
jgi:hypothetical protein